MSTTPEGKAISRMNAMKHGLRATDELFMAHLKPEEQTTFDEILTTFYQSYNPQNPEEELLVDRIAIQHFRLYRLYQLEYLATNQTNKVHRLADSVVPHLDRFSRYDWRIERQIRLLHNRLYSLYHARGDRSLKYMQTKE